MTRAYARFVVATITLLVAIILPAPAHASLCATRAFSPHDSRPALGPHTGLPRAPAARSARTRLGERRGAATPVGATPELAYHDARSTLWGWPSQNPLRFSDPEGRFAILAGIAAGEAVASLVATAAVVYAVHDIVANDGREVKAAIDGFLHPTSGAGEQIGTDDAAARARDATVLAQAEHTKNARPSSKPKHEKGKARKEKDAGNEKGDKRRKFQRSNKKKNRQSSGLPMTQDEDDEEDDEDDSRATCE